MTRRDMELIARAVAAMLLPAREKRYVAEALASAMWNANPRFNRLKWHVACSTVNEDDYAAQR